MIVSFMISTIIHIILIILFFSIQVQQPIQTKQIQQIKINIVQLPSITPQIIMPTQTTTQLAQIQKYKQPQNKTLPSPTPQISKQVIDTIQTPVKQIVEQIPNTQPIPQQPILNTYQDIPQPTVDDNQIQEYISKLKKNIDTNKSYPPKALKRHIEGIVEVEFEISQYGELISINILNGDNIFFEATKDAIEKSLPLKPKENILQQNTKILIKLNYIL